METLVLGVSQVNLRLLWLIASESGDRNKMSFIGKVSKISSTCVDIPNFVGVYEYTYPLPPFLERGIAELVFR